MDHSICMSRNFGKEHAHVHDVSFDDHLHSFAMYIHAICLTRSILPYKLHDQLWAIKFYKHGHSLGGYREMLYDCGCTPKAPNIYHFFSDCEKTWAASKWWGNHLPYHYMMKLGDILRWSHMWDYDPPPSLHLIVYVLLVLIPHDDDALIFVGSMIGGMAHWLDVSIGNEASHIYSCFKRRMGHYMDTTLHHLFPYEKSHMFDLCLWEEPLT